MLNLLDYARISRRFIELLAEAVPDSLAQLEARVDNNGATGTFRLKPSDRELRVDLRLWQPEMRDGGAAYKMLVEASFSSFYAPTATLVPWADLLTRVSKVLQDFDNEWQGAVVFWPPSAKPEAVPVVGGDDAIGKHIDTVLRAEPHLARARARKRGASK